MNKRKGFTLIEMLIVVVIIGILSAVVSYNLVDSSQKARIAACRSNVRSIDSTIELMSFERNKPLTSIGWAAFPTGNIGVRTDDGAVFTNADWKTYFPEGGSGCPGTDQSYKIINGKIDPTHSHP